MRERRYGAKGERACKPNCKFSVSWIIGILVSILISIWNFFRKGGRGRGWCGLGCKFSYKSTYKYTYNLTYKYLGFFPKGKGNLWKERRGRDFGFSSVFCGLSPRLLTRKLTYNKTCNPTYNPSYCPHTSAVVRGGTAVCDFGTAEPWSRKRDGEGQRAQREERLGKVAKELKKVVKTC